MPALTILASSSPGWLQKARFVSKSDAKFLFNEIHVQRCYEKMGVRLDKTRNIGGGGTFVIDIGANVGMFATRAAEATGSLEGAAHVIAAEPLPATFAALEANIALHKAWCTSENIPCAYVTPLQVGIGDESCLGTTASFTFYPNAAGWCTQTNLESPETIFNDMDTFINNALDDEDSTALSLVQRKLGLALRKVSPALYKKVSRAAVQQLMAEKTLIECPMTTVSSIIEEYNIKDVLLLKIDCERGEEGVLQGIRQDHWSKIQQAAIEVHSENLDAVLEILRNKAKFENVHTTQTEDLKNTSIFMVFAYRS